MGTSSRRRGRGSHDVRRNAGAALSTVHVEVARVDPRLGSHDPFHRHRPENPKIARTALPPPLGSPRPRNLGGRPTRAEIPSRTALCQARVACHAPHSRKNGRNPVERAWKRPSSMSRKGPLTRYLSWWRGQDLNLRPSGYEPDELPDCSTPRRDEDGTGKESRHQTVVRSIRCASTAPITSPGQAPRSMRPSTSSLASSSSAWLTVHRWPNGSRNRPSVNGHEMLPVGGR